MIPYSRSGIQPSTHLPMKRIFLVDDHPLLREGVERHVESIAEAVVCGSAATAAEAMDVIPRENPDLVIMDMTLPDKSGLELMKDLRAVLPNLPVLIFSMHDELLYAERAMRAGAKGYLMKGSSTDKLTEAIERVLAGELFLSNKVSTQILHGLSQKKPKEFGVEMLSDRELEIFDLIGRGNTNSQIADRLHISPRTVDAHRTNIKTKLGLPDGSSLVRKAVLWVELAERTGGVQ